MNRKSFLRNCLMAAAISVLPKSLLPSMGEIEDELAFDGIIPTIERFASSSCYTYDGAGFTIKMLEDVIHLYDYNYHQKENGYL